MPTLFTIGHGNRSLDELFALLKQHGIEVLVDIRAHPGSRRNPQFSEDSLRDACEQQHIFYHWAGRQLGGMRTPVADSPHSALNDEAMRGYADYMQSELFQKSAAQMAKMAATKRVVMMCAEIQPEQCHRSLLSDYLTLQGVQIEHILSQGQTKVHLLSEQARRESAALIYDRQVSGTLDLG